jgi:hypothetical protein
VRALVEGKTWSFFHMPGCFDAARVGRFIPAKRAAVFPLKRFHTEDSSIDWHVILNESFHEAFLNKKGSHPRSQHALNKT